MRKFLIDFVIFLIVFLIAEIITNKDYLWLTVISYFAKL